MNKPNYHNGSIVNLMSAIGEACGATNSAYAPHPELDIAQLKEAKNIILLLIDGLGYDYIQRFGQGSTLAKHLKTSLTSVFPTTTSTAITTFATGTAPMQHAVTGWFMYLRELGCVTAVLPFTPRAGMQSFGEKVSAAEILQLNSWFPQLNRSAFVINHKRIIDSQYSLLTTTGAQRVAYYGLSDFIGQIINLAKIDDTRKYIHAYWADFDSLCHGHGVDSDLARQHFHDLDEEFKEMLGFLQGTDSVVIVTADHGLIDCESGAMLHMDDHPQLARMLTLPLCGEPRVAYCYVKPGKLPAFEAYVQNHLSDFCDLQRSEDLIENGYFGLGEPNRALAERIGDYTLLMKSNYIIKDRLPGEKPFTQIGVHGGLDERELMVPLIVVNC